MEQDSAKKPDVSIEQSSVDQSSQLLREAAQITASSFHSSHEAIDAALAIIGRLFEGQILYVARFELEQDQVSGEDASGTPSGQLVVTHVQDVNSPPLQLGPIGALNTTYCQTVLKTKEPLLVEDSRREPFYQQLAATEKLNIGSYIGIPLVYSTGQVYGTLCSLDPLPRSLYNQPEKIELMQIIARFLISYIEREELTAQLRVAESVQAEAMVKEQQARAESDARARQLEAIFDSMSDGVLICDQAGGNIQSNVALRRFLSLSDKPGTLDDIYQQQGGGFVQDEYGLPLARMQLPGRRVLNGEHLSGENMIMQNIFGEKRYLNVSGTPIYDQDARISGGVVVFRDVTERYLLERQTHDALNAILTMTESLAWLPEDVPAFLSSAAGPQTTHAQYVGEQLARLTTTVLHCQYVGIGSLNETTSQLQLIADYGLLHAQEYDWWKHVVDTCVADVIDDTRRAHFLTNTVLISDLPQEPSVQVELGEKTRKTEMRTLVEAPMLLGNRLIGILILGYRQPPTLEESMLAKAIAKLTGLVIERERLFLEQSEARASELALQETNRRFNEFLSIASHELKGPLASIKGNLQLIQRKQKALFSRHAQELASFSGDIENIQKYYDRAVDQIGVQDRLINDLLDVSRIQADKLELRMQPCDLAQIVRDAVEDQQQIAEDRVLHLTLPAEKAPVLVDADRIAQVVNNYLTNALKYSAADQAVNVSLLIEGNMARVMVQDRGPGLSQEEQEHIWERFYRAKGVQVLSGHGIGLGLGLHICRTIIERQSGKVGLQSAPGEGSIFWFMLPLVSSCAIV